VKKSSQFSPLSDMVFGSFLYTHTLGSYNFLKPRYKNCRILLLLVTSTSSHRLFICLKKIWCLKDQQNFVLVLCDFLLGSFLHTTRSGSFHNCLIVKLFGVGMYMWLVCSGLEFIYWEQHVQLGRYHDF